MIKICIQCGNKIEKKKTYSNNRFEKVKYCSNSCSSKNKTHYKGSDNVSWKGGKIEKNCVICQETFNVWQYRKEAKFCSKSCADKSPETQQKLRNSRLGKTLSEKTKKKISLASKGKNLGKDNSSWKGEAVNYRALHDWVALHKGLPDTCEHCGKGKKDGKRLVWANKSHEYKRDLEDWMRLCYPCHRKYDFPHEKHYQQ